MNSDIEKYINNEMDGPERLAFEQQLQKEPALRAEVDEQRAFLQRLKTQLLREKIAAAIASGGEEILPQQAAKKNWLLPILGLILLGVALVWYFMKNDKGEEMIPIDAPPIEQQQLPQQDNTPPVEEKAEDEPPNETTLPNPIAENPAVPTPPNQPGVRGEEEENKDWEKMVESVWVTRFEPKQGEFNKRFALIADLLKDRNTTDAFVQLYLLERQSPENDTLSYLKGYCLLEMREGAQALTYFSKVKNKNAWPENIAWYKALAHLIIGEKEKAIREVELITKDKNHLFYREARKLLEVIR